MRPQASASSGAARRIPIPEIGFGIDEECTAIINGAEAFDVMMRAKRAKNVGCLAKRKRDSAQLQDNEAQAR
jgi:hypothetical protein